MDNAGLVRFVILLAFAALIVSSLMFEPAFAVSATQAGPQQQNTSLMQQSDFHKRQDKQKQARTMEKQMASVAATENGSPGLDYVVLVFLVASVTAVYFLSKSRMRTRRYKRRL